MYGYVIITRINLLGLITGLKYGRLIVGIKVDVSHKRVRCSV